MRNEFEAEDTLLKQAMSREQAQVPPMVREKMELLYASLPELAQDRRRYVRRRRWRLGASIALLLAIVVSVGLASPTTSDWLGQLRGDVLTTAGIPGMGLSESSDFKKQTVTDHGIKLTLDEVTYDGGRLSVRFLHKPGIQIMPGTEMVSIDGKPWNAGVGGTSKSIDETMNASIFTFNQINSLPSSFDVTIHVNDIMDSREGTGKKIVGDWEFQASIRDWRENVREIAYDPPLKATTKDGIEVTVTGVLVSPLSTKVSYELVWPEKDAEEAAAPKDRKYPPAGEKKLQKNLNFRVFDDRGVELEPLSTTGSRMNMEPTKYSGLYSTLHEDTMSLHFSVDEEQLWSTSDGKGGYSGSNPVQTRSIPFTAPLPQTVQFDMASITFSKIEFGEENTFVDYEVKGDYPYQGLGWWVENEDRSMTYRVDRADLIRLSKEDYSYRAVLPAWPNPSELSIRVIRSEPSRTPIPELDFELPLTK